MSKRITSLFATVVVVGLIASCSTMSSPILKEAQSSIASQQYDSTLAAAKRYIRKHPGNAIGYFYKGEALGLKTEEINDANPEKATPLLKGMDKAFTKATQIADTMSNPPDILKRIHPVRRSIWHEQYNTAVKYIKSDSLRATVEDPLEISIVHLVNATIALRKKARTWNALAQVHGMKQEYKQAAMAQKKFLSLADSTSAQNYVLLARYYNRSSQSKKALNILQKTKQKYPANTQVLAMLADTYSMMGKANKSISIVKELVKKVPSNGRYRMSLGTKIYRKELKIQNKYDNLINNIQKLRNKKRNASGSQANKIQQKINQKREKAATLRQKMQELSRRAKKQIKAAIANGSSSANAYYTLGVIHLNNAHVILKTRNITMNRSKVKQLMKQAKNQLQKAKVKFKKATQLDPDNKRYWRSLWQVYTALGNDQKAAKAKKKAGIGN